MRHSKKTNFGSARRWGVYHCVIRTVPRLLNHEFRCGVTCLLKSSKGQLPGYEGSGESDSISPRLSGLQNLNSRITGRLEQLVRSPRPLAPLLRLQLGRVWPPKAAVRSLGESYAMSAVQQQTAGLTTTTTTTCAAVLRASLGPHTRTATANTTLRACRHLRFLAHKSNLNLKRVFHRNNSFRNVNHTCLETEKLNQAHICFRFFIFTSVGRLLLKMF